MLSIKNIILVVLLGVCIFLIIKMYSHTSSLIESTKNFIAENIEEQFEEINDKIQAFEENLDNKLNVFGKKINEMYSVQNKITKLNEIAKMNGQNILNQLNQYDEDSDVGPEEGEKNCVYNSLENMDYSPQKNDKNLKNNTCFVKVKDNNVKDLFYMSPQKSSKTSPVISKNNNDNNESVSSKSTYKSTTQSKNSLVLELENNYFKTNLDNSPKSKDIQRILDDTSNAFSRHGSFNDLLNIKNKVFSENVSENVTENNEEIEINDPPIVLVPDVINNLMNKKVIEIK
jgi:hypothetical protein